jgi:hypothetical protein
MTKRKRQFTLVFAGLAILTLVALSAGLSGVELRAARPFTIAGQESSRFVGEAPTLSPEVFNLMWQILSVVFAILLPFAVFHFLVSPEGRKRVIRNTLLLSLYAIFFLIFLQNLRQRSGSVLDDAASGAPAAEQVTIPDIFLNPPPLLIFIIGLLIVTGLAMLIYFLMRRRAPVENELQVVAREARLALAGLRAGADVTDTILRCYLQMTLALNRARGLQRKHAMTPREFETYLVRAGLHTDHIQRLTRLFEGARYSAHPPTPRDEREAEDCLQAIVETYGSPA